MLSQLSFFNRQRRKEPTPATNVNNVSIKCVTSSAQSSPPSSITSTTNQLSSPLISDPSNELTKKLNDSKQLLSSTVKSTSNDQVVLSTKSPLSPPQPQPQPTSVISTISSTPIEILTAKELATTQQLVSKINDERCDSKSIINTITPAEKEKNEPINQLQMKEKINQDIVSYSNLIEESTRKPCKPGSSFVKLTFRCQLAHGSATQMISGFTNMKELYEKIAATFNIPTDQILYCTLNTPKVDMDQLLGGQIGLEDFIFVHCKGQPKEVELTKNEELLGLTITDNGTGYSFIKKIKSGSLVDSIEFISVGDVIEKIEGNCYTGCRHFEVAKALKDLPIGHTFTIRLIEPSKGFGSVGPRPVSNNYPANLGSGRETLRLRAIGSPITTNQPISTPVIDKINILLESFMGIHDNELATQIWEIGSAHVNPHDFVMAIGGSDLQIFSFNEDLLFDLWGVINDNKSGRISSKVTEPVNN